MLRRDCLGWMARAGLAGCWPAAMPAHAQAGAQIEEPLADPVRLALRAAIEHPAPPEPDFPHPEARLAYLRWLGTMSPKLARRKPELAATPPATATRRRPSRSAPATVFSTSWRTMAATMAAIVNSSGTTAGMMPSETAAWAVTGPPGDTDSD